MQYQEYMNQSVQLCISDLKQCSAVRAPCHPDEVSQAGLRTAQTFVLHSPEISHDFRRPALGVWCSCVTVCAEDTQSTPTTLTTRTILNVCCVCRAFTHPSEKIQSLPSAQHKLFRSMGPNG